MLAAPLLSSPENGASSSSAKFNERDGLLASTSRNAVMATDAPVFLASKSLSSSSKLVLLTSRHFVRPGGGVKRPAPSTDAASAASRAPLSTTTPAACVELALLPTALVVTVMHGKASTVERIPLWHIVAVHARGSNESGGGQSQPGSCSLLEVTTLKAVGSGRGCCGGAGKPLKRHVYQYEYAGPEGCSAAEARRVADQWAAILQHAALGTLPAPPSLDGGGAGGAGGASGAAPAKTGGDVSAAAHATGVYSYLLEPGAGLFRPPVRRLLVYINPAAGPGKAEERFDGLARPVLEAAGCEVEARVSARPGYATEQLLGMPWSVLQQYSGILSVGGDGSLSEVVNGLMGRRDWERAVGHLVLGIMPAGSGNGLSISLLSAAGLPPDMPHAALMVAKGVVCRMDVASTFVAKETPAKGEMGPVTLARGGLSLHSTASAEGGHASFSLGGGAEGASLTPALASPHTPMSPTAASPFSLGLGPGSPGGISPTSAGGGSSGSWGHRRWQFLSTEWAIVADIDLESERLRWLGASRFDVYGALRGLALRRYKGRFCYLPADKDKLSGRKWTAAAGLNLDPLLVDPDGSASAHALSKAGAGGVSMGSAPRLDAITPMAAPSSLVSDVGEDAFPVTGPASGMGSTRGADSRAGVGGSSGGEGEGQGAASSGAGEAVPSTPLPVLHHLPPFEVPVPLSWRTLEGTFTFLWITNTSHQSSGVAVSPGTRHGDGSMAVTLVRDVGPATMIRVLLALDTNGSLHGIPGVEHFSCLAWRLEPEHRGEPLPADQAAATDPAVRAGHGHVAIDGEPVPYGPVQAELHPGLIRVFGPGWPAGHVV